MSEHIFDIPVPARDIATRVEGAIGGAALAIVQSIEQSTFLIGGNVWDRSRHHDGSSTSEVAYRLGETLIFRTASKRTVYPPKDEVLSSISAFPHHIVTQVEKSTTRVGPDKHDRQEVLEALHEDDRNSRLVSGAVTADLESRSWPARKMTLGIATDGGVVLPSSWASLTPFTKSKSEPRTPMDRAVATYDRRGLSTEEEQIDAYARIAQMSLVIAHTVLEASLSMGARLVRESDHSLSMRNLTREMTRLRIRGASANVPEYVRTFLRPQDFF